MVATVTPQFQLQLTTHTYDRSGRLVRANRLTQRRLVDGSRVTYTYDDANQLTRILDAGVPTTLTYDESGNTLTARNTTQPHNVTLTWDADNRLHAYHQTWGVGPSSERITHTYNGDGQRVERADEAGIVKYVYDGNNVIVKQNTGFATLDQFLYEPALYGKLLASLSRWYHFDPLGASQTLTDGNGDDIEIYFYRPFGEIEPLFTIPEAGVHPFLFVGREGYYSDDEGINKNSSSPQKPLLVGDRFYMAEWGRWLSRDRAGFAGSWTNPYWYVGNNPVGLTDPSGNLPTALAGCIAGAIGSALAQSWYDYTTCQWNWKRAACSGLGGCAQGALIGVVPGFAVGCLSGAANTIVTELCKASLGERGPLNACDALNIMLNAGAGCGAGTAAGINNSMIASILFVFGFTQTTLSELCGFSAS